LRVLLASVLIALIRERWLGKPSVLTLTDYLKTPLIELPSISYLVLFQDVLHLFSSVANLSQSFFAGDPALTKVIYYTSLPFHVAFTWVVYHAVLLFILSPNFLNTKL
jgi:hypothetical protein